MSKEKDLLLNITEWLNHIEEQTYKMESTLRVIRSRIDTTKREIMELFKKDM